MGMDLWLLKQFRLKKKRAPKFSGPEIYMIVVGSFIGLAITFLIASGIESLLSNYVANDFLVPFAAVLSYSLIDLFARLIISPSTFAEQIYYLLPIPKKSYAVQTVLLSFYNLINVAAALFLSFYLIFTSVAPEFKLNLILWFLFIILGNNVLALAIKRWRFAVIILSVIAMAIIFFPAHLEQSLSSLIKSPELGLIYFLMVALGTMLIVYFTYPKEKKEGLKSSGSLFRFNIKLRDPLLWQEVLLIIRNKRPRGLVLTYFILIPYFFFIFNEQLGDVDASSFAAVFLVLFLVSGVSIQYGYLGLAWENIAFTRAINSRTLKGFVR